jgi:predicted house-cleaning noncanonical NTP pyrophosphatase (MazG superfamily)
MKLRKFQQNKLWRDKVVDNLILQGSKIHWTRLNDQDFAKELKLKFKEEADEVLSANNKENLLEEFADILEVIIAFGQLYNFTLQDIITIQKQKCNNRGGFNGRKFVSIAEHAIGSIGEKYCLNDPEKYPEIINDFE